MKHKIKVVMLPTEDISNLGKPVGVLEYNKEGFDPHVVNNFHIYITVSQDVEPIKEGDWRMITDKESSLYGQFEQKKGNLPENDQWSKIIATTDNNLFSEDDIIPYTSLPRVQQSFLKEYVANPDGEYEVEYENRTPNGYVKTPVLKLNQDNTVNITSVKEKIILTRAKLNHCATGNVKDFVMHEDRFINDWIKENL